MRAISLPCFKAYTDHLKRSGRNFLVPYMNKLQFTVSYNSTFSQLIDTSPSPEAANCWDRPTTWLSRPESSLARGAHSHVSSLKWRQKLIKCYWADQAQSLRFHPSPCTCSLLSLQTQSQSVQRQTSRTRAGQFCVCPLSSHTKDHIPGSHKASVLTDKDL